ncbi:hypothetical protein [Vagococcus carniphilus]|uniref:Uncharacterized protein n=1 Tax=Vagococcus carniphilus TaxID=218144 RepID=A0A430B655_9ENTE|nr:hypothetical protein [Vagococcus carniphilus]QNN72683.1 hypothetical protein H9L18_12590 [Vagococcus carniphilus]RSU15789.1 hypothetical protein CBF28_04965 [Vagococcus carniphilus]
MANNHMKKINIKIAFSIILLGSFLSIIGFSLSGFDITKYQTNDDHWYQLISIPKHIGSK